MPGLRPSGPRVWRYVYIYPNTTIDLYPDQVTTWQINPVGARRHARRLRVLPRRASPSAAMRAVQRLNQRLNVDVAARGRRARRPRPGRDGDARLAARPARRARGGRRLVRRPRPARPGGAGVTTTARRGRRARAHPGRGLRRDRRSTGSTTSASRASRRIAGVSPALVHYHFATREALLARGARALLRAARRLAHGGRRAPTAGRAASSSAG